MHPAVCGNRQQIVGNGSRYRTPAFSAVRRAKDCPLCSHGQAAGRIKECHAPQRLFRAACGIQEGGTSILRDPYRPQLPDADHPIPGNRQQIVQVGGFRFAINDLPFILRSRRKEKGKKKKEGKNRSGRIVHEQWEVFSTIDFF